MKIFRLLLAAAALCAAGSVYAQQTQEVVYLKNGSVIHGTVLETLPGVSIKVRNNVGDVMVYSMADVEKIAKEAASATPSSYSPAASPSTSSCSGCLIRGYRGFADGGIYASTLRIEYDGEEEGRDSYTRIGFSTTHGFQFNPHIFLGGGFGMQGYLDDYFVEDFDLIMPIYAAFRCDFVDKRVSPFASFRLGGFTSLMCIDDESFGGAYFNLNFGVRIRRLNIAIGYEGMPGTASVYDNDFRYVDFDTKLNSFVFRVGVDFGRRAD